MSLPLETLRLLVSKGLSGEEILEIAESLETRSSGAERQRRYRDRKRDVTRDVTESDKGVPPLALSPQTPLTHTPPPESITTREAAFDRFWEAYPRKVGKLSARKAFDRAWRKLPAFEEEAVLCGGLERAKAAWQDPQFIPYAASWLNGERWSDEMMIIPFKPSGYDAPPHDAKYLARQANLARSLAGAEQAARRRWQP